MQSFFNLFSPAASSSADADAPSAAPSAPALFDEEEAATVAEMRAAAAAQRELERREVELALADEEADEFGFEDAAHAEARWRAIDEANDAAAVPPPLEASSVGAPPPPPPADNSRLAVSTGGTYRGARRSSEAAAAATAAATSAAYAATSAEVARIQERISALEVLEDAAHNGDESGWSEPLADELQLLRQQLASAVKALSKLAKSSSKPSRLGLTSGASGLSRMGSSFFGR